MSRCCLRGVLSLALVFLVTSPSVAAVDRWQLPKKLKEASGLALSADDRIYTHNDEKGIVYRFDPETGDVDPVFKINDPALRADFEAIAIIDQDIYLVTSSGDLHWVPDSLSYQKAVVTSSLIETGLADVCEVEGLSSYQAELFIACKKSYRSENDHHLLIFRFDPKNNRLTEFLRISSAALGLKKFYASGIEVTKDIVYVISARQRRLLLVTRDGELIGQYKLKKKHHRQAEGVAVGSTGKIYLVSEGKNKGGRLSIYDSIADLQEEK
ncbi:MAG: SdiA-regulated domain-containing protein [bacterium]|nr:hypothetical protein [Gammaproteobacteria bacterium]HIL98873.1 hypothetical protein [Pseudomonadales bacterium]